jgi:hypothetical protein
MVRSTFWEMIIPNLSSSASEPKFYEEKCYMIPIADEHYLNYCRLAKGISGEMGEMMITIYPCFT